METNRNAELAEITARINRWADDPTPLDHGNIEALSQAVQRLGAQGLIEGALDQPGTADDLVVEEATPNRSG